MSETRIGVTAVIGLATALLAMAPAALAQTASGAATGSSAFDHFVRDGGVITYFLLVLSMVTVGLCIDHLVTIRRGALMPEAFKATLAELIEQRQYREILETTAAEPSLLGAVLHAGLSQANNGLPAVERSMEEVMESRAARLFRRIEYLNIIGNISPMVGLFGTVFGMINTFSKIVELGGSPDPKALADGISIALVTTFWGLLVAIPALSVFHLMRNRIDGLLAECAVQADEIIQFFKPAAGTMVAVREATRKSAAGQAPAVAQMAGESPAGG